MLREGRDISDVTLVFEHEDRQGDEEISPGEKKIRGGRLQKPVERRARQGDKRVRLGTTSRAEFVQGINDRRGQGGQEQKQVQGQEQEQE